MFEDSALTITIKTGPSSLPSTHGCEEASRLELSRLFIVSLAPYLCN